MSDTHHSLSGLQEAIDTLADGNKLREMTRHNAADFVEATAVLVVAAREWSRIPEDRKHPWHVVYLDNDSGWRMAHPIFCDLNDCEFDRIARTWSAPPDLPGEYHWSNPADDPERVRFLPEDPDQGNRA